MENFYEIAHYKERFQQCCRCNFTQIALCSKFFFLEYSKDLEINLLWYNSGNSIVSKLKKMRNANAKAAEYTRVIFINNKRIIHRMKGFSRLGMDWNKQTKLVDKQTYHPFEKLQT